MWCDMLKQFAQRKILFASFELKRSLTLNKTSEALARAKATTICSRLSSDASLCQLTHTVSWSLRLERLLQEHCGQEVRRS